MSLQQIKSEGISDVSYTGDIAIAIDDISVADGFCYHHTTPGPTPGPTGLQRQLSKKLII